jgi:hypothetical protein
MVTIINILISMIERLKRNLNYEDREAHDPYKAKDYAKNYE